jgi:hypothetical protein
MVLLQVHQIVCLIEYTSSMIIVFIPLFHFMYKLLLKLENPPVYDVVHWTKEVRCYNKC